jgi:hypothetical protein
MENYGRSCFYSQFLVLPSNQLDPWMVFIEISAKEASSDGPWGMTRWPSTLWNRGWTSDPWNIFPRGRARILAMSRSWSDSWKTWCLGVRLRGCNFSENPFGWLRKNSLCWGKHHLNPRKLIVNFWGRTFRVFSVLYCGVPHAGFRRNRTSCWEKTRWPCKEAWRDLIWASNSRDFDKCYAVAQPPGPRLLADPCGWEILKSLRNTSDE